MSIIYQNLHQFSNYITPIDLSFHQYLLLTEEPILVHTGTMAQATELLPQLKDILGDLSLKYIVVSHFESDECGGLSLILQHYPKAKTICSEITARQLVGFGITNNIIIGKPGTTFSGSDFELEFISYPSEMHLWEGILVFERKRGIFFSSDVIFDVGETSGKVIGGSWETEIDNISVERVPNDSMKDQLIQDLKQLDVNFIAVGHGPCLKIDK